MGPHLHLLFGMSAFEIVVPYRVSGRQRELSMRIGARDVAEALSLAATRAVMVRPLLGGGAVDFVGEPTVAPRLTA